MPWFGFGGGGKSYHCRVLLLDDSDVTHVISSKTKGLDLLDKVFMSLNLYERDYFGLRFRDIDDKTQWLDPEKSIKKQIDGGPPYTLYFGVKFYAADPTKLKEELTRYQFFLQIKKDILQGRLPCSVNVAAELCAYAVQSELGDYDESLHTENYVSEFRFVPNQNESLEQKIAEIHPKLRGQVPADAELNFLERVKWLEMYGVDLHPVRGQDNLEYFLGLTPTGIVLFRNSNKIGSFIWPKITKLKFKGHQFIIRVNQGKTDEEKEYTFALESKHAAKQLWKYCAEHHTFFRLEKANDVPASAYNFLFKKGSGFRFSGRTQQELLQDSSRVKRPPPVVQRVQSKRYTRRPSADESQNRLNRSGNSAITANTSNISKTPVANGDLATTFYSVDGNESSPWGQRSGNKSGLYTSGHNISNNIMNETAPAGAPVSARFPKPHRSTASLQSDAEIPKRKISSYHAGYSSGEEIAARRKRSHYYSGYTSGASDGESVHKMKNRAGSEPNMAYMRGMAHHGSNNRGAMVLRHESRDSVATTGHSGRHIHDYRYRQRESGSKSDGEQNTRQRRQQNYYVAHRSRSGLSDTEMVPALNVYRSGDGQVVVPDPRRRPRNYQHRHHHHHHHHHHHPRPRGPPSFDPENAKVLLELGPDTAPPESENSYGDSTISSIPEEKPAGHQSQPANLNHSFQSDHSSQLNRSNHSDQMNQPRFNHVNQRPDQFIRGPHPHPMQGRPVSMDMKYVAGYHYVEHGPRPVHTGQGNRMYYRAPGIEPVRAKMMGAPLNYYHHHHPMRHPLSQENGMVRHEERSRYMQQYLPPHVVRSHQSQDEHTVTNNNDKRQFVEQVVGPPSNPEAPQVRRNVENELANYSISTEL